MLAIRPRGSQATVVTRWKRQKWKNFSQMTTEEGSIGANILVTRQGGKDRTMELLASED
ncbi:unnamed protein product [Anisakis simplex]|uniref:Uncharacterized protein n=1 Tax=Anisakis simplex TaxID=6269 RepID=A0A0M3JL24_ANISI|nr:unnamed protein product [Anisakis simplex]